nr:hypothetical protein [Tanacetum cinerariifolium]
MAYFVEILTPDSAWSCMIQCNFPIEGIRSIISMVSISLEGFLPPILLLVVIIVAVVIVAVILVVVVIDAIVGVVIVVASIGGMRSIISMVSISLEGFVPPILLLVVIIVAVVIAAVILVVIVIDAIIGVVIVVASIGVVVVFMIIGIVFIVDGGVSHIIKLLFVIIAFAMVAACASRATATPFVISCRMVASVIAGVADVDVLLGGIYQHIHANTE